MSDIYLIRHGFTPSNNANYNGQEKLYTIADDKNMPLEIEYGRKQAEEIGKFLKKLRGNNLVLVSPYRRAQETANIALKGVKNYTIKTRNELREISSGVHYGKTIKELLEMYPEAKEVFDKLLVDQLNTKYLHGESQNDVKERTKDIAIEIKNLSESNEFSNILIFAHGTVNRWLCYHLTGKFLDYAPKNGEIFKISNGEFKSVFLPESFVPLGYVVDIEKHKKLNNS